MEFSPLVWGDAATWPYVGYVNAYFPRPELAGGYSVGTGTLIGPRVVLTAGHVVYDPSQGGKASSFAIRFGGPNGPSAYSQESYTTTQWRDNDSLSPASSVSAF